ncbi:hypothetical protein [Streptomyces cyaneofuscatus]|uniref:hypothetical protein n=1 Tax=Streptomyces cyaneofuscatus TaxID=66883 RepID=UPI0033A80708
MDEDIGAAPVGIGDLRESVIRHRDVIPSRVGSGIAGPQTPGQGLAGMGQATHQRVKAEAASGGRCRCLLLGVAGDQRSSARSSMAISPPPSHRRRGHGYEHLALVTQHAHLPDRLAAIAERHREIEGDPARGLTNQWVITRSMIMLKRLKGDLREYTGMKEVGCGDICRFFNVCLRCGMWEKALVRAS